MIDTSNVLFAAFAAATMAVAVILIWVGIFSPPSRSPVITLLERRESIALLDRLRQRYELLEPPFTFDGFVLLVVAIAGVVLLVFSFVFSLPFVGMVIAAMVPFVAWRVLNTRHTDIMHQREYALADFLERYAALLRQLGSVQRVNLEIAKGDGFYQRKIAMVNQQVASGVPLEEALREAAESISNSYWAQFVSLIARHERVGGRVADSIESLGKSVRRRAVQIGRAIPNIKAINSQGYILLIIFIITMLIMIFSEPFSQYANSEQGIVGQIVASLLGALSWFLTQALATRGLFFEVNERAVFSSQEIEAMNRRSAMQFVDENDEQDFLERFKRS